MTLWNEIKDRMMRHPLQTVHEQEAGMTYEELVIFAETFAARLRGERACAIVCHSEMAAAMALLGCFAAEVTAIPLSPRYGTQHCRAILDRTSPTAIITDANGSLQILRISDAQYRMPAEHPALIMCTSGTTGTPKGAMLCPQSIQTNVADICSYFAIDETDTILIARPLYHCAVLTGEFLTALYKGTRIRFYSGRFDPHALLQMIQTHAVTALCGTPTSIGMMARLKKKTDIGSLRSLCISGECMSLETGQRIAAAFPTCRIYHLYGLTEASPRVSFLPPSLFFEHADCVGRPLPSVSVRILKEDQTPCAPEEEGMLWVKGDNVMLGYYDDPDKSAQVLVDGWLCTGDMAVMTQDSLLKIKGRRDHLIIKAGMNIYPAEVEAAIKEDPRVKDVLVYGMETHYGTQIGMKLSGDFSSVDEVKRLCVTCLPPYQIPSRIELTDELDKNASGKIIRRNLS